MQNKQQKASKILASESHLHLYGCLDADTLWEVTEERSQRYQDRFQWFLAEYQRATGIEINPSRWWQDPTGLDIFRKQFLCLQGMSFDVFQAKFNLLIALFPPNPNDLWLAKKVFEHHAKEGGYKEYRTFLPLYLPQHERFEYLKKIIMTARDHETTKFHPRLAISFMRGDAETWDSYGFLCQFLDKNPELAPWITGIDFCGSEKGHPPISKNLFFRRVHEDNKNRRYPLEILYHVGEMWQDISIASAARWCVEAAEIGAHRLGHALALGMNCHVFLGRKIIEDASEAHRHLEWLRLRSSVLHDYGFSPLDYQWLSDRIQSNTHDGLITWTYDDELIDHTTKFQSAALKMVLALNPVVESCPTSNMRIGSLSSPKQHPLRRFLDHNLRVTMSTDDPGVFDISLANEEENVLTNFGVTTNELLGLESRARNIFER